MRIHLVNYEEALGYNGILSKYAYAMMRGLAEMGHEVSVSAKPMTGVDINHHINYQSYVHKPGTRNSLQITHITDDAKLESVTNGMKTADVGICFSKETEKQLKGIGKLYTVLPAHDMLKQRPLVISILTNVYPNGCKREKMFIELLKTLDPEKFVFLIMGKDWANTLDRCKPGFAMEYTTEFVPEQYDRILKMSDYSLYFGKDEGSMGILDATYARIRTIAPNGGFHKDLNITHPFDTQEELNQVFVDILKTPADDLTWSNYCKEHVKIWKKAIKERL